MKKQLVQLIIGIAIGLIAFAILESVLEVAFVLIAFFLAYYFVKGMLDKKDGKG